MLLCFASLIFFWLQKDSSSLFTLCLRRCFMHNLILSRGTIVFILPVEMWFSVGMCSWTAVCCIFGYVLFLGEDQWGVWGRIASMPENIFLFDLWEIRNMEFSLYTRIPSTKLFFWYGNGMEMQKVVLSWNASTSWKFKWGLCSVLLSLIVF